MKVHYYVAITVVVVLIGIGYGLTVWMHATLGGEHPSAAESEIHTATESSVQEATTSVVSSQTTPTEQASSETHEETGSTEVVAQEAETTATESSSNETAQTTPETPATQNGEATETASSTASSSGELTPVVEQTGEADAVLITIEVKASGQSIDLSGWRLSDVLGVAGHTDHVYYFGEQTLQAGQTLTVYSSCGRDQGLTLYWCLSHPLTMVNSEQKELLLHNAQGEIASTCTIVESSRTQVRYECV